MSEKTEKQQKLESGISNKGSALAVWRGFFEHPGWKMYCEVLAEQSNERKGEVLFRPLGDANSVYAQEFQKGEISGLALAQIVPAIHIEQLEREVKIIREQLEKEDAYQKERVAIAAGSRVDTNDWHGGDEPKPASD